MAAVALELPLVDVVCPHFGPAENTLGEPARIGGVEPHRYVWFEPHPDTRGCAFCDEPVGDRRCIAIMADGDWRYAHIECAVFAKQGRSDMAIDAPWKRRVHPACAKCGGRWYEDHVHTYAGVFCDDEGVQPYEEPISA